VLYTCTCVVGARLGRNNRGPGRGRGEIFTENDNVADYSTLEDPHHQPSDPPPLSYDRDITADPTIALGYLYTCNPAEGAW
jgi:hypothetical protein